MKTALAMILILLIMTSMAVYLDRYYLAEQSNINTSHITTDLVDITDESSQHISQPFSHSIEARSDNKETLRESTLRTELHQTDDSHTTHGQRKIEIDATKFATLTAGDWITLPLTYGSITLKVTSKDQSTGYQTLIVSDVDTGHNSVITVTGKAVFGTLTTASGNHQLTAFKPSKGSTDHSSRYRGTVQEERPEHELFSQLRESDELFPNAEDLLNQTEHSQNENNVHHHELLPPHHTH